MSIEYPCIYFENGKCKKFSDGEVTSYCIKSPCVYQTPSNADRIRAMSDEELAELFVKAPLCRARETKVDCRSTKSCLECLKDWLKQPAEDKPG